MALDPPNFPISPSLSGEQESEGNASALLDEVCLRLAALTTEIRREHERAAHREQIIDRLHGENQELRHGLVQEALAPARNGLYRLYDTVRREAAHWRGPEPPAAGHAGALLEAIAEEVAEVLARTGAERLPVEPGDGYDPSRHRPVGVEPVEAGRDGRIVAVLTDGFTAGERVLRKAGVVIGRAPEPRPAGERNDAHNDHHDNHDHDEGNDPAR
jgi:molecular chaperone GrpE